MMRLLATGIIWAALCGLLCAETSEKKPKASGTAKPPATTAAASSGAAAKPAPTPPAAKPAPAADSGPVVIDTPVDAPYQEPLPMKEKDEHVAFGKIYDFVNDPDVTAVASNKPLEYEFKYFNHGAITQEQLKNRKGHYFIINWKYDGPPEELVLRFDYRQQRSRERINTLLISYPAAAGHMRGMFSVRGDAYVKYGKINSWRLTVLRKGRIVAERQSFIW